MVITLLSTYLSASSKANHSYSSNRAVDTANHTRRQQPHHSPPKPPDAREIAYNDCLFTNRYTSAQRLKHYPFSKAVKILVVSYPCRNGPDARIYIENDTSKLRPDKDSLKYNLHIKNGVLNKASLVEIKKLNKQQINRLTNIIYNTQYKKAGINGYDEGECFNPRNAIIFIDSSGKVFDYIEICFECLGAESQSQKITIGTRCNQKFSLLKEFFIDTGIKYGTIRK